VQVTPQDDLEASGEKRKKGTGVGRLATALPNPSEVLERLFALA